MIAPAAPTADTTRAWSWKLNWFRQSELDGALLLGRMVRSTDDAYLIAALTRHCADEARHSLLWSQAIAAARLPAVRIHRPYQSFYWDQSPPPRTLPEVLVVTHVFEQRVD
ncbi:MAG TPA: hypothetical protein VEA69_17900 [Tepidisphaeraceae bacterium]|nr:hypothetical protein [Tepidisphaeraceae bacterium]